MSLVLVDTTSALAVSDYLDRARTWLATAVEMTGPAEIAAAKAEIATAAEATKQLNLSKDIQLDAVEMVRRAEYALGKALRKGQDEGLIRTKGQRGPQPEYVRERDGRPQSVAGAASSGNCLPGIKDIAPDFYDNGSQIGQLSDGVEPEAFEAAIESAKAEGNLSRANLVRKVRGQNDGAGLTRQQRADLIADLAAQGLSSRQMPKRVGVTEETVRLIARDFEIEIPADKIVGRSRRIDWTDAVAQTVVALENSVEFLESQVDLAEVDFTEADEWVSSLTNSIRALNRFVKQIKEQTHV